MPPILTPPEQQVITDLKEDLQKTIDGLNVALNQINNIDIPENDAHDLVNKIFFDFYHYDIINRYEEEIKFLNGVYLPSPLIDQDLLDRSKQKGRLYDPFRTIPDVVRIPEFDGGNISNAVENEVYSLSQYDFWRDRFLNGLLTSATFNESTEAAISAGATTLTINSGVQVGSDWDNISIGDEFIVTDGNDSFVGKVVGLTNPIPEFIPPMPDPPIPAVGGIIEFSYVTGPLTASVGSGASVNFTWGGFNNTERTNKTSSNYQDVMDEWLNSLDNSIAIHLGHLPAEKAAIAANLEDDPTRIAANVVADVNLDDAIASYTSYKSTLIISNTGFTTLDSINSDRSLEITARVAEADSFKAFHYEVRFFWAEQRASSKGTLTKNESFADSIVAIQELIDNNQAQLDGFDSQGL
jgi:hypothetical protein